MGKRFSQLSIISQSETASDDFVVGTRDNGDGTFTDYRYEFPGDAARKKRITVDVDGNTLVDSYFSNTIEEIVTNGQTYISEIDFTQSGTIITSISFAFYIGQVLIAKI